MIQLPLKNNSVSRFVPLEVAYHLSQAIPYLMLFCTGAAMLGQRLTGTTLVGHRVLSIVHQIAGLVLVVAVAQTLIVSLVYGGFRELLKRMRKSLSWGLRDLVWAAKVPFGSGPGGDTSSGKVRRVLRRMAFVPSLVIYAEVPIAYFFMVMFFPVSVASGLAMMFVPSALGPWIVHVVTFVPASIFLTLHLYRAFVYRKTRLIQMGVLLAIGIIVAGAVWACSFEGAKERAIAPGDLYAGHAEATRAGGCFTCHRWFQPPPDSACLDCHPKIARVMAQKVGYHGQQTGPCRDCHADHQGRQADIRHFDGAGFNHNLARFPIDGKHRRVSCRACHLQTGPDGVTRTRYIGLRFEACTDCHINVHNDPSAADCRRCHSVEGWRRPRLAFDHDRDSRFRLEGRHVDATCEKCHPPAASAGSGPQLYGVGARCADCHQDPHRQTLGADCQRCHNESAWTGRAVAFRHNRDSRFALRGAHPTVACEQCHKPPKPGAALAEATFRGLATDCAACHKDPHQDTLAAACTTCHSDTRWTGKDLLFQHNRDSEYPLLGKHRAVACAKCHKPAPRLADAHFVDTPSRCADCHRDPHLGKIKRDCTACHDEKGWKGNALRFTHNRDSAFKIDALHSGLSCVACHEKQGDTTRYKPTPTVCQQCHLTAAQSLPGQSAGRIDKPDPHLGRATCVQCHAPAVNSPTPDRYARTCQNCHNARYRDLYFDWTKSLADRETRARKRLAGLQRDNAPRAAALARRIAAAKAVGLHNIQLARKLWDDILAESSSK